MNPWPHQIRGHDEVLAAHARGERRVLLVSPTGSGKTLTVAMLVDTWIRQQMGVSVYTNRKLLVSQLSREFERFGLEHGLRASGHGANFDRALQISSLQTESRRAGLQRRKCRACKQKIEPGQRCKCGLDAHEELHQCLRWVMDESHINKSQTAISVMDAHEQEGAYGLGVTATPLDLEGVYQSMVVAGTSSELRACGALVPAIHYGPDEPDLKALGRLAPGEDLSEKQASDAIMREGIFGRVLRWFQVLNPQRRPTILFAPGVRQSIWFAEQFEAAGIPAAHIDGDEIWFRGKIHKTSQKMRDQVLEASRTGEIVVLSNMHVCREGIDAPWIQHLIMATVFGSLGTYIQTGGRGLRACPSTGKEYLTVQDHGGNYHRHGSLNADREWDLRFTNAMVAGIRAERLRSKKCRRCAYQLQDGNPVCRHCSFINDMEPVRCPSCTRIVMGFRCPCGWVSEGKRSREVVQTDGTLKRVDGDLFKPRRICQASNAKQRWESVYYRSKNSKNRMSFAQAFALYAKENFWGYPDLSWPLMPIEEIDTFLPVADVPYERLVPKAMKVSS